MSELKHLVKKHIISKDYKIKSICAPLKDHLHTPIFIYYKIQPDGTFVHISNHPEQMDYFYNHEIYRANPYFVHPSLVRSGCVITSQTPDPKYLESEALAKDLFQMQNSFLMIDKVGDSAEGFLFVDVKRDDKKIHYYLNHMDLLRRFTRYFKKEAGQIIEEQEREGYNIGQVIGENFHKRNPALPLSNTPSANHFLKEISPLTERERQCLELFQRGNSAQGTAAILGLSRRTVEHYFESIKDKLDCYSKWELLDY